MEPTIYKPSIYNGAGIYKTGAEGGGGSGDIYEYEKIFDKYYAVKEINGLIWICENLQYKGNYNPNPANYADGNKNFYISPNGFVYNREARDDIISLITGEWRVASDLDWKNILEYAGGPLNEGQNHGAKKIKSKSLWSNGDNTDDFNFNIKPNGTSYSGLFNSDARIWTSRTRGAWYGYVQISAGDEQFLSETNDITHNYMAIRLCKDA